MAGRLNSYMGRHSFARGASKASGRSLGDLKLALAEVDGLFGAMEHLDKAEPASDAASPSLTNSASPSDSPSPVLSRGHAFLTHSHLPLSGLDATQFPDLQPSAYEAALDDVLSHETVSHENVSHEPGSIGIKESAKHQWTELRSLREAMEAHYKEFQTVCAEPGPSTVRDLLAKLSSAKVMREQGILTFRDVITGHTPTEVGRIVSFACLSYVVSKMLLQRGKLGKEEILADIVIWRNAISGPEEQKTFDWLAYRLWPEARDVMHFLPLPHVERDRDAATVSPRGFEVPHAQGLEVGHAAHYERGGQGGEENSGPGVPDGLDSLGNIPDADSWLSVYTQADDSPDLQECAINTALRWHDEFDFSSYPNIIVMGPAIPPLGPSEPPDPGRHNLPAAGGGSSATSGRAAASRVVPVPGGDGGQPRLLERLQGSSMFQVVARFFRCESLALPPKSLGTSSLIRYRHPVLGSD